MSDQPPRNYDPIYLEDQYGFNGRAAPDMDAVMARWSEQSEAVRASRPAGLDQAYGPHDRQKLDMFEADQMPRGTLFFIHGGYWTITDRQLYAFLAPRWTAAGYAVVIPSFAQLPEHHFDELQADLVAALEWVHQRRPDSPITLIGHSSGAHLTAMLLARQPAIMAEIAGAMCLSGIYDLTPLQQTPSVNAALGLTAEMAAASSLGRDQPETRIPVLLAVGDSETEEYQGQSHLLARSWPAVAPPPLILPQTSHLGILDRLATADGPLFDWISAPNGAVR